MDCQGVLLFRRVLPVLRLILWPAVLMVSGSLLPFARAVELPLYEVGDVATNTVVTPVALTVRDPEATTLLQAQEAAEIPPIVRYAPTVADEVERVFRARMASLREAFTEALEASYTRRQIDNGPRPNAKWSELVARFQNEHRDCPGLARYLPYWALGQSDEHLLSKWVELLREAMNGPIRSNDPVAPDGGVSVCLVTVPSLQTEVGLRHAERHGVLTAAERIVPLSEAARDLAAKLPDQDRAMVDFFEQVLRPNCLLDEELTRLARQRQLESLSLAHNYAAGQTLVREGQVIDAKAVAALNALRARTSNVFGARGTFAGAGTPRGPVALPEGQGIEVKAAPARNASGGGNINVSGPPHTPADTGTSRERVPLREWVLGAVSGLAVLLVVILVARRGAAGRFVNRSMTMISSGHQSAQLTHGVVTTALPRGLTGESESDWRRRALEAESKAEKAMDLARAKVAHALKDEVVERLSAQHYELIDYLQSAAKQIAGLEERLEGLQGPLSERLRVYEQRIAELEEELASKDDENRSLIRAHIQTIRERMALEKRGQGSQRVDPASDMTVVRSVETSSASSEIPNPDAVTGPKRRDSSVLR
jgi:hypothetical protein